MLKNASQFSYVVFAIICFFVHFSPFLPVADDAYIHLRLANNLIKNGAPYFNPYEAIYATSSLAWTCAISLIGFGSLIAPLNLTVLNFILTLFIPVLVLRAGVLSNVKKELSLACGILVSTLSVYSSCQLMETPFAIASLLLVFIFILQNNLLGAFISGMLPFIRPEFTLVLPLILSIYIFSFGRKSPLVVILISLGAFPWLYISWHWFGTIIPHTILAKRVVYQIDDLNRLLILLLPDLRIPYIQVSDLLLVFFLTALVIGNFLATAKSTKDPLMKKLVIGFQLFCLGVGGGYAYSGTYIHEWYIPIVLCPLVLIAICGFNNIRRFKNFAQIVVFLIPSAGLASRIYNNWTGKTCFEKRVDLYLSVGSSLKAANPSSNIMSSEIGALGYAYDGYIYDAAGLVTPEALNFHPLLIPDERSSPALGSIPLNYFIKKEPEYLVTFYRFAELVFQSKVKISNYLVTSIAHSCNTDNADPDLEKLYVFTKEKK